MKVWAILFAILIGVIIILADTHHLGLLHRVYDFPLGDKAGHFILYGLLSLLANLSALESVPNANPERLAIKVSLVLALLIGLEEVSQLWIPSRMFSLLDLTASYLGVTFFAWLAIRIRR